MEYLPIYIDIVFILTAFITILLLYKVSHNSKPLIIAIILWMAIQSVISLSGFYTVTSSVPPRFGLLLLPPMVVVMISFFTKRGKKFIDGFDVKLLTLLHVVRIPVELCLYWLYLHQVIPEVMTFEGRNFDILCGVTAPFIYYYGYIKKVLNKKVLITWNIICLLFLANIVVTAVLSAPFPIQQFAFDQPNIALLYFPFIWLPCVIVPAALFAHLMAIRRLVKVDVSPLRPI